VNCPACGYYNPEGSRHCSQCGLVLPMAATDAFCAAHPDVKASGACSRCGTFGCGACLTQRGVDWLCAACLARRVMLPWDERATLGLWPAWWKTSVQLISNPSQALANAEPDAPLGSSLLFATLSTIVGFAPTLLLYAVIIVPAMLLGLRDTANLPFSAGLVPVLLVAYVAVLLVMNVASVLMLSGFDHLGLLLFGAQPKSYTVTVRAHALSMGPYLLGLLPLCSLYVFPIWAIVLRIIANMHLHKTTAGKATAAVLLPMVLLCGGVLALYGALIALAMAGQR